MFHVFEHILDPYEFLGKCQKLLGDQGVIIIEVPHVEDPLLSIYNLNEYKDFYFQPMHPYVYSAKALQYVFRQSGFQEVEKIFFQRYGLDNHLAWLVNKKVGGNKYFSSLFADNETYKESLVEAQKTDTIFFIAKKRNK